AWTTVTLLTVMTLLAVLVLPGLGLRRAIAHTMAGVALRAIGMPVTLLRPDQLPEHPCVVVANHASYLDGVVLKAALPARFSFVIKKEMVRVPFASLLLRRIGSQFVDRFNRHTGGLDARRLMRAAAAGQSLVFFPEGTFTSRVGLDRFHSGAFATAQRSGLPVVPVVIRGARRALRCGSPWPKPGRLEVEILTPIAPADPAGGALAVALLKDQARARILMALGEPDLTVDSAEAPTTAAPASLESTG
ncbi:MAG TPA: lysophospholipid acyltransferase family protein, partial [Steroidobacteraceae bacterium]|nr:lysophospholipid acyltransferase family protein [Steroidobacteraceae bacterium]